MGAALHIIDNSLFKMGETDAAFRNIHQNLIDGCKSGDQKAQFQIYKLYYKAMYNTSLRILNNKAEAIKVVNSPLVVKEDFLILTELQYQLYIKITTNGYNKNRDK